MSQIRTWTNGAAWLAEFETGADAMDSLEGGWLDVQPELAEEGCAAVRAGVEPLAQDMRTGELGRGVVTVVLHARGLEVEVFSEPIETVAAEHFGGVDRGDWGTRGGEDPNDQWQGVDVEPDYDGIDEAP